MKHLKLITLFLIVLLSILSLTSCGSETPPSPSTPNEEANNDGTHTHAYTEQIVSNDYLFSAATCDSAAKYFYSCNCGQAGTDLFQFGETLSHDFYMNKCKYCELTLTSTANLAYSTSTLDYYETWKITGSSSSNETFKDKKVVIPVTYKDSIVTVIGQTAFYRKEMTHVIIPESIHFIDAYAFALCENLVSVSLPSNLTSIEEGTFAYCASLSQIEIPETVASIAVEAFQYCDNLIENVNGVYYVDNWVIGCDDTITILDIRPGTRGIADSAFENHTNLTSVTIPDSVNIVGKNAFKNCSALITSENDIDYVDNWAINSKSSITTATLRAKTRGIANYAFYQRTKLESITIPSSVYAIGANAFVEDTQLKCVYISDLTAWCKIKFANENSAPFLYSSGTLYLNNQPISEIAVPQGITAIESYAFCGLENLTAVTIPSSVTSIGQFSFGYCSALASINLPDGITTIGNYAFLGCSSLENIIIPQNTFSLGHYVFLGCLGLETVTIQENLRYMGVAPFCECPNLTTLTFSENISSLFAKHTFYKCDNLLSEENGVKYLGNWAIDFVKNNTSIIIREGTVGICENAFLGMNLATSVTIPSSITFIGNHAFADCNSLKNVYISDVAAWCQIDVRCSPMQYASKLHLNNQLITELVIPDGVSSICDYAFANCTDIASIEIPSSVTSLGQNAFARCTGIRLIYLDNIAPWYNFNFISKECNPLYYANRLFIGGRSVTSIDIPDGITQIKKNAFAGWESLVSVTIPNSVTEIGDYAFNGCKSLATVNISENVTSIGSYAFADCSSLASIQIPQGVTAIGSSAFYNCKSLKSITIPKSVTSLGNSCFLLCTSLETAVIDAEISTIPSLAFSGCSELTTLTLPETLTTLESFSISECSSLTHIELPDSITFIGDNAMMYNESLESIRMPANIETIGAYAFIGCTLFENIDIPDSILTIGTQAFAKCTSLKSVVIHNRSASVSNSAFLDCTQLDKVIRIHSEQEPHRYNEKNTDDIFLVSTQTCDKGAVYHYSCSCGLVDTSTFTLGTGSGHNYQLGLCLKCNERKVTEGLSFIPNADKKSYALYSMGTATEEHVCIPSTYNGKPVTRIATYTYFSDNDYNLKSIYIPKSITIIDEYSFAYCETLETVIMESVTTIEDGAFVECSALKNVTLGNALTTINQLAFMECTALTNIQLPQTLDYIGESAFGNCTSLLKIVLPDSLTTLGHLAFINCTSLKHITVGSGLTEVSWSFMGCHITEICNNSDLSSSAFGSDALHVYSSAEGESYITIQEDRYVFYDDGTVVYLVGCLGEGKLELPESYNGGTYMLGDFVFIGRESLTEVTIPDNVTSIGKVTFQLCTSLEKVVIGNGVQTIDEGAFSYCTGLTSITIPKNVTTLCTAIFCESVNLTQIIYEGTEEEWNTLVTKSEYWLSDCTATVIYKS